MSRTIYLDAPASTPLEPAVVEVMTTVLHGVQANPSATHGPGRTAHALVEQARQQVADLLATGSAGVIFTSGATEANALALQGLPAVGHRDAIVSCTTEHPAVLRQLDVLREHGRRVRLVGVDRHGRVDLDELSAAVGSDTLLVTVMAANNETGVLADLDAITELAHDNGALVHTDASQLLAWGPLPADYDLDLITISAHKMHGPQGVGALIANRTARRALRPLLVGGGQERSLRSGTTNVAGVAGLGAAALLAAEHGAQAAPRVRQLRDQLHAELVRALPVALLNGHPEHRLPNVLNVAVGDDNDQVDAQAVLAHAPRIAASVGSACTAGALEPSPVLQAMGLSRARASSSLRLGLSRLSTPHDVQEAVPVLVDAVHAVRAHRSPRTTSPVPA